ncbi:Ubiquitin-like superfamily protein [Perilla frutescens var. hirtella]|uniref:Ubiquitin-like superfamily protein n=1 Tax=Perilla frutescens var. hirtella TaxID=608512 RepID=A0AAD4JGB7_PERFH|nr:Ubiquitin-like superfamily protein [Perilla frutescens var. frutescens]KAH6833323.1 Ubiquitin-like superfamily protein [Perilla frutescens var. hirtella]
MIKLRPKIFSRSNSKLGGGVGGGGSPAATIGGGEIKWELRPGGMLVQKRENQENAGEEMMITIRVSTVSKWHDISVQATSTFGELKILVSILTKLEPHEQRLLFKGKEREDDEHLHMVGVRDKDKVLMLEDPAIKERKLLLGSTRTRVIGSPYRTIRV